MPILEKKGRSEINEKLEKDKSKLQSEEIREINKYKNKPL